MEEIFVGVDWGSETHQVCALDGARQVLLEASFAHSGKALGDLVEQLLGLAEGRSERVAVAIEVPRGPVVELLLEKGFAVYAINPKQLDRFRDRHTAAGAKDDRRDAFVLADSLRTDRPAFRPARLGDPLLVQLRELSRAHDDLKAERVALGNRLREQLQRYFPQLLAIDSIYDARWLWELLLAAPTPLSAQKLSLSKLRSLLSRYRVRRVTAEEVRDTLGAESLHVAPGVTEAAVRHVALLLPRLRLVDEQKTQVERELEKLLDVLSTPIQGKAEHRDARILRSLPGLGTLVCATVLAEAWEPLEARDYNTFRALCGTAPVTKRSGKQLSVLMRHACNHRLRTAMHYWAGNAVLRDPRAKAHYAALRAADHAHPRALRGVADRLVRVLFAMLQASALYDHERRNPAAAA